MKYLIILLLTVSSTTYAMEPLTLISGTLSILTSVYTLSKEEKVVQSNLQVPNQEEMPVGYHYENIVDTSCNCIKRVLVANVTTEYPF